MKILKNISIIIISIVLLLFISFFVFIHVAFDGIFTGGNYTQKDLIENYNRKEKEILDAKNYFQSIVPQNANVEIEFDGDNKLAIFHLGKNGSYESNWDIKIGSAKTDSLINELGWTNNELQTLKERLDDANCISISSRKPIEIGWQRSGMGLYSYVIFDSKPNDSIIKQYNDGCTYIYYKDKIALEYGGGAVGPQCFPKN